MRFFILTLLCLGFSAFFAPVHAGEVIDAGEPVSGELDTNALGISDIYTRQLAYKKETDTFRSKLEERRADFREPQNKLERKYAEKLQAQYDNTGPGGDPVMDTLEDIEANEQISSDLFGEGPLY